MFSRIGILNPDGTFITKDGTVKKTDLMAYAKIRTSVAAAEAPAHGMCILDYSPKSNPGLDYQKFVDEVYRKIRKRLLDL